ncbi:competence/damage-inducible protein A [bacterium]|nr:competence/damage-inducible protein A [bacterium]
MKAEIVSVGTELLLGEIVDTNASTLSQKLAELGIDVHYRHTVGDNHTRLTEVIATALGRADIVILTGGLGPTEDDLTREAIAAATGQPLVRVPESEQRLREFFAARNRPLADSNLKQADAPVGAVHLENVCGTAPGIFMRWQGRLIFAAPGPPTEMREMAQRSILPILRQELGGAQQLFTRSLQLMDIGESQVADILGDIISAQTDPTLALYAAPANVRIRMATKAPDEASAEAKFAPVEARIRELLGNHVFGLDSQTMAEVVEQLLRERGQTLAVAESCTGGLLASRITDISGASDVFLAGVVSYANEAKTSLLGVPAEIIAEHGAVSEECARAMAEGVRRVAGADYGLATTGIAGPTGGTDDKPVGLVYMALADERGTIVQKQFWPGTREQFKQRVSQMVLGMLRKRILGVE